MRRAQVALDAEAGTYVEVKADFADGGRANGQVLVVPPVGFYESAAPTSAAPTPAAAPTTPAPYPAATLPVPAA